MNQINLFIDTPKHNSSLLYISGYYCLDPLILIEFNNKLIGWLPSTELEKAKIKSKINEIYNIAEEIKKIIIKGKDPSIKSNIILEWLKSNNIEKIIVPENFPAIEYEFLKEHNFQVEYKREPFYESRVQKNIYELEYIKENTKKNEIIMSKIYNILAESKITNDKKLKYNGEILTAEFLQKVILKEFLDFDLYAEDVIVASGEQTCFPHEYGYGEILAEVPIIIDIYPRNRKNFYYTDMTRTFCKGKASDQLKKLYNDVLDAQNFAFEKIKAGVFGKDIHNAVLNFFQKKGYKTDIIDGFLQGFVHGTGHGVGLDCHELPYISQNGTILLENSVVSVEPGLYYLDIGGVRLEDLVVVKKDGIENLNSFPKVLEIE